MPRALIMPNRDVIVIGTSAGGVEALKVLFATLPRDLPASLFVVMHVDASSSAYLAEILNRVTPLRVVIAEDGSTFEPGCAYVAPPDRHLLIADHRMVVARGPKENRHRPAIDPLFRSAAWSRGPRVVGVVLTGNLDDGAAGLWAVKSCGGVAVVQDPKDAMFPGMPESALGYADVDHCAPLSEIGALIDRLAREPADGSRQEEELSRFRTEVEFAMLERETSRADETIDEMNKYGRPSAFSCPACRGTLWELAEGDSLRYRCHVGHAYSSESLLTAQTEEIEVALYSALRALEEKAAVSRRMAARYAERLPRLQAARTADAQVLDEHASIIRGLLTGEKKGA